MIDRIKYEQVTKLYPNARVSFTQIEPVTVHIASLPISLLKTYEDLINHIKPHWRSGRIVYKWTVSDARCPQIATGKILFSDRQTSEPPKTRPTRKVRLKKGL